MQAAQVGLLPILLGLRLRGDQLEMPANTEGHCFDPGLVRRGVLRGELAGGTHSVDCIVTACRFDLPHDAPEMILDGELRQV